MPVRILKNTSVNSNKPVEQVRLALPVYSSRHSWGGGGEGGMGVAMAVTMGQKRTDICKGEEEVG